ncbi:hypothetical protein EC973_002450 [Apophysomyces ossiformis]|uniref:Uncharacterized protein n=1 Tax=Apophysomyces ossiformis TaxID=679940 RepID=A0A8H7BGM5_9FUNG|nr:hypothetical protein EC973_002450 [Apophysomyces ossiformis]
MRLEVLLLCFYNFYGSYGRFAGSIEDCPSLEPRTSPPTNVRDLRPDDIKVVSSMGDRYTVSILAGFAARGIQGWSIFDIRTLFEYRGASFGGGGDAGFATIPNMIKRYRPDIVGASVGEHLIEYCGDNRWLDHLNVAQSGALIETLDYEVDLLMNAISYYPDVDFGNDWKLVNILIGYLDVCSSCKPEFYKDHTPEVFESLLSNALSRLRKELPKTLVNLSFGMFNIGELIKRTNNQKYCQPLWFSTFQPNKFICECSSNKEDVETMAQVAEAYNEKLRNVANMYNALNDPSFGVIYTPSPLNITSFPLNAFSNIDCLHLSVEGHEWAAKSVGCVEDAFSFPGRQAIA